MILNIRHLFYILVFLSTSTFFGQTDVPPTVTATGNQIYCPQSQQRIVAFFNTIDPDDTLIATNWNARGLVLYYVDHEL